MDCIHWNNSAANIWVPSEWKLWHPWPSHWPIYSVATCIGQIPALSSTTTRQSPSHGGNNSTDEAKSAASSGEVVRSSQFNSCRFAVSLRLLVYIPIVTTVLGYWYYVAWFKKSCHPPAGRSPLAIHTSTAAGNPQFPIIKIMPCLLSAKPTYSFEPHLNPHWDFLLNWQLQSSFRISPATWLHLHHLRIILYFLPPTTNIFSCSWPPVAQLGRHEEYGCRFPPMLHSSRLCRSHWSHKTNMLALTLPSLVLQKWRLSPNMKPTEIAYLHCRTHFHLHSSVRTLQGEHGKMIGVSD